MVNRMVLRDSEHEIAPVHYSQDWPDCSGGPHDWELCHYAADSDRKSISGYLFLLAGAAIGWQVKKQKMVAQLTVEEEYAGMEHAEKELICLQYLLRDLGMFKYAPPTVLVCNNQGTISLTKNSTHHAKTKHVDVQLHFIRDHVEKGKSNVEYCPTLNMLADLMTKGLPCERHERIDGNRAMRTNHWAIPS